MTFTINSLSRCSGGGTHIHVEVTINGNSHTVQLLRSELDLDPDEIRDAAVSRMRSAVKEANASTPIQIQNALIGKTFKV